MHISSTMLLFKVWVALHYFFLSKLADGAKEMTIAYRYGVSDQVDAYLFICNLISWPISVWFSILTIVLVPLAARIQQVASAELPRFKAGLFAFTLVLGCDLVLIFWFGLPILLHSLWVRLSISTVGIATDIVPDVVVLAPLGILVSLFLAWMPSSPDGALIPCWKVCVCSGNFACLTNLTF